MINFECPECGVSLATGDDNRGKRIRCPDCRKLALVPDPGNPLMIFDCPECGSPVQVRQQELGLAANCPACKKRIRSPSAKELESGTHVLNNTRCGVCGLQANPELRCPGCAARFCSEICRQKHAGSSPHGCAATILVLLLGGTGI